MKKIVLSFDDYVFKIYENENNLFINDEKLNEDVSPNINYNQLMTLIKNKSKFNENIEDGKKALLAIGYSIKQLTDQNMGNKLFERSTKNLYDIYHHLNKNDALKNILIYTNDITFNPVWGNKISVNKFSEISNIFYGNYDKNYKLNINDIIASINASNFLRKANKISKLFNVNYSYHSKIEDGNFIGSGIHNQIIIENASPQLITTKDKLKNVNNEVLTYIDPSKNNIHNKEYIPFVLVQYYIKDIKIGGGNEVDYSTIRSLELNDIPQTGSQNLHTTDTTIIFKPNKEDKDWVFEQGKSELTKEIKFYIKSTLSGLFASINSIEVRGSASQEGTKEINKKLAKERAEVVANYLEKILPNNVKITISDKFDIQSKESKEDRRLWRRVTLKVNGTKRILTPKDNEGEPIIINIDLNKYLSNRAIVTQVLFVFLVDSSTLKKNINNKG